MKPEVKAGEMTEALEYFDQVKAQGKSWRKELVQTEDSRGHVEGHLLSTLQTLLSNSTFLLPSHFYPSITSPSDHR